MSFNREEELTSTLIAQFNSNITEFVRANLLTTQLARLTNNIALVERGEATHNAIVKLLEGFKAQETATNEPPTQSNTHLVESEFDRAVGAVNTPSIDQKEAPVDQKSIAVDLAADIVNQIDGKRAYENFQREVIAAKERAAKPLHDVMSPVKTTDEKAFSNPVYATHTEPEELPISISSSASDGDFVPFDESGISKDFNSINVQEIFYDTVTRKINDFLFFKDSESGKYPHVMTVQNSAVGVDSRSLYRILQASYPNVKAVRASSGDTQVAVVQIDAIRVLTVVKKGELVSAVIADGSTNEMEVLRPDSSAIFNTALNELF